MSTRILNRPLVVSSYNLHLTKKRKSIHVLLFHISLVTNVSPYPSFLALQTIVGDDRDLSELKERSFRELNVNKYYVATIPNSDDKVHLQNLHILFQCFDIIYQVLITQFNGVGDDQYVDPRTKQIVTFDHVQKVCY